MKTITVNTRARTQLVDITNEVENIIPSNFKNGIVHLFCMHTTGGKLVDVVHLANAICLMLGLGLGADGLQSNISPGALERLGVTDFEMLLSESVDLISQVEEEFQLEKV